MKTLNNTPLNVSYEFIGTDTLSYEEGDTITLYGYGYSYEFNGETLTGSLWLEENNHSDVETKISDAVQYFVDYYNENL